LLCDEKGSFHFVELKATAGNAVDLRPHQVAWLSNHKNASVWVLVKKLQTKNEPEQIFLFHGRDAVDLKLEGLKVEPVLHQKEKFDWEDIFRLICP
jgi:phosphoribosyl 1,2-cyclic phosphodiesterase